MADEPTEINPDDNAGEKAKVEPAGASSQDSFQKAVQKLSQDKPSALVEMMSFAGSGMMNPLHSKMEPQHITQALTLAADHDQREFTLQTTRETNQTTEKRSIRRYVFAGLVLFVALIVFTMWLFRSQPQVLTPILTGIIGLASGFLGGLGIGRHQSKSGN